MILKYNHENLEIKNLFTNTIRQLEYMKETFNILNSTFCTEFNELHRQYEKDYNNFVKNTYREPLNYKDIKSGHERDTIQWDEIENDMNFLYKDSFEIHENINTIVIEALIIKINAIIEKFFINLSWLIYKNITENTKVNIMPPDYKKTSILLIH